MSHPLPTEVAKELLHLDSWFDDVDALLARGRETYLADPLLQHAADGLLAKIGEASGCATPVGPVNARQSPGDR